MANEREWHDPPRSDRFHDFWYKATPKIYEWLSWLVVLAAIQIAYQKSPTWQVLSVLALGYLSLIFYFGAFFLRHPIHIPGIRNRPAQWLVSSLLAIALAFVANRVTQHIVFAFVKGSP